MLEQSVENSNAVTKVTLKQRHERAAVPRLGWDNEASGTVMAHPIVEDSKSNDLDSVV